MLNGGIGSWPVRRARSSPTAIALRFGDLAVTYGELRDRVTKLAHALRALHIGPNDRVAYLGQNHPAFVESMFATHTVNAIFVPLNFRLASTEIDYMLDQAGARLLIYGRECAQVAAGLTGFTGVRVAIEPTPAGDPPYDDLLASGSHEPMDVPVTLDDPALILYTSGTTGRPKGAVLTHGNLHWNCFNLLADVDVASDDVSLVCTPLFHVAALNQILLPTFFKRGTSVIMPGWDVDGCFDLVKRWKVTWIFGVAAMFASLAQSPRWPTADLSSLRHLMSGGAPIPRSLIQTYHERGLVFTQGYGLTETAPGATFLDVENSMTKAGTAGTPCFFCNVRVVRPDLSYVDVEEPGEVQIQGPNVTPGYWGDPDATAQSFAEGGWFRSGDIATVDAEGFVSIVGRLKDMFISGGENVYPAEVESAIFEHPGVAECAVVGIPDERWGEVGAAFVVLRPGAQLTDKELEQFLQGRLARYKIPVRFDIVDDLPRTGSGKVQKAALRDLARAS